MPDEQPSEALEVQHERSLAAPSPARGPTALSILETAIRGGVTKENVEVVKDLLAMAREQRADEAKAAFARAFFQMRKNMPQFYADKEAKDRSGNVTFVYCSEDEMTKVLEPHWTKYGFTTLFGQTEENGRITVSVTLMHEEGHQEIREFTVRAGAPNAMKDAAMCDTGAATTAWRHLMMKMFGLKSRIQDLQNPDARIEGERIAPDKAIYINELLAETNTKPEMILKIAGVKTVEEIKVGVYDVIVRMLMQKKESKKSTPPAQP